jgi:dinuclear metal center YbgI/SA1388 family protein
VPRLADLRAVLDEWYDPRRAESGDPVGLVCGDPGAEVDHVLLAVDAVPATVAEASAESTQLLVTHHPLLHTPVHGVPADDPKGALVHRMIRSGVAHLVVHTNGDVAEHGVSDALAERVGLTGAHVLDPQSPATDDKLVVFVPLDDVDRIVDAMSAAGAGRIGRYERCAWSVTGTGTFRPRPDSRPSSGRTGETSQVREARVEMVVPSSRREEVVRALRAVHPYEEPAIDMYTRIADGGSVGLGRIGQLVTRTTLRGFVNLVARALPSTAWGVRGAGHPDRIVRTVAVCGGSGGSLVETAREAGADAYLTADLRHHPALEAVAERQPGAMGLVDAAHWATEAPWLAVVAARLRERFATEGLKVTVSTEVTDPWTLHAPSPETSHIRL